MKMIPSHAFSSQTPKKGETQVFELLNKINLSKVCYGMHTLNLHGGNRQRWHELDFIVISNRAILGLEVKAGQVSCYEGTWYVYTEDGSVAYSKHISPLVQASNALDHLRTNWMKKRFGERFKKVPFVKLAILCSNNRPDPKAHPMGPELVNELTAYSEDLYPDKFKEFLNSAIDYEIAETPRVNNQELEESEVEEIKVAIRPNLDKSYPSPARMGLIQKQQDELTFEQYVFADLIDGAKRYILDGGAGTGKTFLMVYDARRKVSRGERVVILVPSIKLAKYIQGWAGEEVSCITPESAGAINPPFDVLLVDEAQNFISEEGFSLMDSLVKDGMEGGSWRIYGDFQNQLSPSLQMDKDVFDMLVECTGNNSVFPLKRNVRNTPKIVRWLEKTCGARIGKSEAKGAGPEVEVMLNNEFRRLLTGKEYHREYGEIHKEEVVVLYPGQLSNEDREGIHTEFKNVCELSTIDAFRGLESNIIYVKGLGKINNLDELKDQSYSAVSRARSLCIIEGDEKTLTRFNKLMRYCRDGA